MFWRREVTETAIRFDPTLRDFGDVDFVLRLLAHGCRFAHHPEYLASFAMTGENRSLRDNARKEKGVLLSRTPVWLRALTLPLNAARLASKLAHGCYRQRGPIAYAIYVGAEENNRRRFEVSRPNFRWPSL